MASRHHQTRRRFFFLMNFQSGFFLGCKIQRRLEVSRYSGVVWCLQCTWVQSGAVVFGRRQSSPIVCLQQAGTNSVGDNSSKILAVSEFWTPRRRSQTPMDCGVTENTGTLLQGGFPVLDLHDHRSMDFRDQFNARLSFSFDFTFKKDIPPVAGLRLRVGEIHHVATSFAKQFVPANETVMLREWGRGYLVPTWK